MVGRSWECPFCGQATTLTDVCIGANNMSISTSISKYNSISLRCFAISCPNPICKELYLEVSIHKYAKNDYGQIATNDGNKIFDFHLRPSGQSKPQPEYIPRSIREDYHEACLILDLSPKASATLARRCLQGIIRDFWEIPTNNRGNLGAEINFIKDKVTSDTWDAIRAVRSVGDIGAHMEKDVNQIVSVEKEEAALLISLIETLLSDWYVERHKRNERNRLLVEMAEKKLAQKRQAKIAAKKEAATPEGEAVAAPSEE